MDPTHEKARGAAAESITEKTQATLRQGKDSASRTASRTADALQETADHLSARGEDGLGEAVGLLARKLTDFAGGIERRSLDDLSREARQLARDNPAMFIAGGVALGVALGRFFKASGSQDNSNRVDPAYGSGSVTPATVGGSYD